MLVDYFPLNIYNGKRSGVYYLQIPITEMIVHICIWSLIMEELRQVKIELVFVVAKVSCFGFSLFLHIQKENIYRKYGI